MGECSVKKTAAIGGVLLIAGGLVGAGVALIFAPQSGKQTRRDIARYGRRVRRQAEDIVDDFAGNVHGMVESIGERAEEILDRGKDMAHDAKLDLIKALEEGQAGLEKQKQRLAKLIG